MGRRSRFLLPGPCTPAGLWENRGWHFPFHPVRFLKGLPYVQPLRRHRPCGVLSHFWPGLRSALVSGLVGIVLLLTGYWLFDWINHAQIDVQKELCEKNVAVAIVVAAPLLGIAYICATLWCG